MKAPPISRHRATRVAAGLLGAATLAVPVSALAIESTDTVDATVTVASSITVQACPDVSFDTVVPNTAGTITRPCTVNVKANETYNVAGAVTTPFPAGLPLSVSNGFTDQAATEAAGRDHAFSLDLGPIGFPAAGLKTAVVTFTAATIP